MYTSNIKCAITKKKIDAETTLLCSVLHECKWNIARK